MRTLRGALLSVAVIALILGQGFAGCNTRSLATQRTRLQAVRIRGGCLPATSSDDEDGDEEEEEEDEVVVEEMVVKSSSRSSTSSPNQKRKTVSLTSSGVLKSLLKQIYNFFSPFFLPQAKGGSRPGGVGGSGSKAHSLEHLEKSFKTGDPSARVQKELRSFLANPPEHCKLHVGANIRSWVVTLVGAEGTIYAGESYKLKLIFPKEYPSKPPSVYFLKPCPRHMHVYSNGDICLNLLGRDWRPTMTAQALVVSILSMLSSAKEKKLPQDNSMHADNPPGQQQEGWLYHDDRC